MEVLSGLPLRLGVMHPSGPFVRWPASPRASQATRCPAGRRDLRRLPVVDTVAAPPPDAVATRNYRDDRQKLTVVAHTPEHFGRHASRLLILRQTQG